MEIKTTPQIIVWAGNISTKKFSTQAYFKKWVAIDDIIKRINHIRNVVRDCSFEDDFGEQCFKYSDLNNNFKILERELENKPKVNTPTLSQNNKKEDGIPPTNKLVGIRPKRL